MKRPPFGHSTLRSADGCLSRGKPPTLGFLMSNHFHLLVRVPVRPEGFDVPMEVILARMERAVGENAMKLIRRDLTFWETTGNVEAIEKWRQRQVARMFYQPGLAMPLGFAA